MLKKLFKNITGISELEAMEKFQEERITNLSNVLLRQREFKKLQKEVSEHKQEIINIERSLEGTIDKQYDEIQKLKTQLEQATNNRKGKFYVFNPQHGMPRKIYDSYEAAAKDAEKVAKISNGQKVFVLKIVSGVSVEQTYEDYAIMPEDEIPF